MVFIYIVCPDKKEARRVGRVLLKNRLAACVNIFPIESFYWWKNKIVQDKEAVLLVKTLKKNFKRIETTVQKAHSYKIPCIVMLPVIKVNQKYFDWLKEEVIRVNP